MRLNLPLAPDQRRRRWLALLLAVLTLASFSRLFRADFTNFDDTFTVARNPQLTPPTWSSAARNWTRSDQDIYMPLTRSAWSAIATVAQLQQPSPAGSRLNPLPFHVANVLLHVASVLLVFSILLQLGIEAPAAAVGAALFAVHPVQVEPVAWVSGLKDVLYGTLSLAALRLWIAPLSASDRPMWRDTVAAILFVLALLAKPSAVTLPLVAVAIGRLALGWPWRLVLRRVAPWVMMAAPIAVIAARVQPAPLAVHEPIALRPLIAGDATWFYIHKLLWPASLAIDYGRTPARVLAGGHGVLAMKLALLLIAAAAAWRLRRRWPVAVAGAAVFVAAISAVSGWIPFDFQQFSTVADHYLYLAMLGPAMIVAAVVQRVGGRLALAVAAAITALLAAVSFHQTAYWVDAVTLMSRAAEVNPGSALVQKNLGLALIPSQPGAAVAHLRIAARLSPHSPDIWDGLGLSLQAAGDPQAALAAFATAQRAGPHALDPLLHEAALLDRLGQRAAAANAFQRALELQPNNLDALVDLAGLRAEAGRLPEAIALYRRALAIDPSCAPAQAGLAAATASLAAYPAATAPAPSAHHAHP